MATTYDAIVIGTGQSGPPLAERMAGAGMKVAVIERHRFGGTCVNTGCIPTKTLVASARAAHVARRAGDFGVRVGGRVAVDMKKVKARKDAIVAQSNRGVARWMRGTANVTVYKGHARFVGPKQVQVNGDTLEGDKIFINVGGRAEVPDMPGFADAPYLTNSSMMAVDFLPRHLVVIGGSYIGLEFGQMYRRFGSRVTIVERGDRLIKREDPEISDSVRKILEGEGIEVRLNAECLSVARRGRGVSVGLGCRRGPRAVAGSHLLLAVGRVPNTGDLGLDRAGVETDKRGFIKVDDRLATSAPGIWALGDCNGRGAFTHTAYHDYEVVAANLLDDDPRRISERIPCYALYTDPPVGRVGMSMQEARASGRRVLVAYRPMTRVSRAREMSETHGFMRALVDADTRRLLGAVVFGAGGDEIVHALADVMYADAPYTVISRAVHVHPTVSELIPTMLQELTPLT